MKAKRTMIVLICVLLASCFCLGAADVVTLANPDDGDSTSADRLIGTFITTEPLNLPVGEDRVYAVLRESTYTNEETGEAYTGQEHVFDGVEGIAYFTATISNASGDYTTAGGDEAISDSNVSVSDTDAGRSVSMEGTIYASASGSFDTFFCNPVYQTAGGDVYMLASTGMSSDCTDGSSLQQELKEETTYTVNGQTETTAANSVRITVSYINEPTGVTVLQLDADSEVLARQEYAPGALPETLTAEPGTAYIIVETQSADANGAQTVSRALYQPEDEDLSAFYCRDDGICVKQYCAIEWDG